VNSEKGPSPLEPGPFPTPWSNYFLIFTFGVSAADP
jgi:hypothetical protein